VRFTPEKDLVFGPPLGDLSNLSSEEQYSSGDRLSNDWVNAGDGSVYHQIQTVLGQLKSYPDHILHPHLDALNEIELTHPSERNVLKSQGNVIFENYPNHIVDPGLVKKSNVKLTKPSAKQYQNGLIPTSTWFGEKQEFATPLIYQDAYLAKLAALKNQKKRMTIHPAVSSFSPSTWLDTRPSLLNRQKIPVQDEVDLITIEDVLKNSPISSGPEVYTFQVESSYNARDAIPDASRL
jgi:hypothetical protein